MKLRVFDKFKNLFKERKDFHMNKSAKQRQFEAILSARVYNPEPFNDWAGGECPVEPDTVVEVVTRGGVVSHGAAKTLYWKHVGNGMGNKSSDTIAWRLYRVKPFGGLV